MGSVKLNSTASSFIVLTSDLILAPGFPFRRFQNAATRSYFDSLINLTLRKDAAVNLPRMFVSLRGLVALFLRNLRRLLAPALVDGFQTPLGAAPRGADRLVADDDEDRIGVCRSEDAQRDPTAALDLGLERYVAQRAVGDDLLFIYRRPVDDQFDGDFA